MRWVMMSARELRWVEVLSAVIVGRQPVTAGAEALEISRRQPNQEVSAVHSKTMPVILTDKERETWLSAPWSEAGKLQRPLPDGALLGVRRGEQKDETTA